jgi:hypothetical protein
MSGSMSRRKGARAENAVVQYLRTHGHPNAERRIAGTDDTLGDITGTPGVVWEIKDHARDALPSWVDQLDTEITAARCTVGAVIHKRRGCVDVGRWYATMPVDVLLQLLAEAGYGDGPLTGEAA